MNTKQKFIFATTALAATLLHTNAADAHLKPKDNEEKCYGVVKAGKNQCASDGNKHACAGQALADNDPNEWIIVPKGLCEKLAQSSLEPAGEATESEEN